MNGIFHVNSEIVNDLCPQNGYIVTVTAHSVRYVSYRVRILHQSACDAMTATAQDRIGVLIHWHFMVFFVFVFLSLGSVSVCVCSRARSVCAWKR